MPVEIRDGQKRFAPAEQYDPKKNNTEVPELYGVFPFDLCNFTTPDAQIGIDTYNARTERGFYGWRQDGQMAALLGLTEQAAECLAHKTENSHPNHRFPAYWGPISTGLRTRTTEATCSPPCKLWSCKATATASTCCQHFPNAGTYVSGCTHGEEASQKAPTATENGKRNRH